VNELTFRAGRFYLDDLLPALQRLDQLLEQAITAAQVTYGSAAEIDAYRGISISQDEVECLLAREIGIPLFSVEGTSLPEWVEDASWMAWLQQKFGLSAFDIDLVLIALAPEVDLRYERLYAYLQDDVMRKRPTVDLALNLLCPSAEAKLLRRKHFAPSAPLIRQGLLQIVPDPNQIEPPFLSQYLKLEVQIVHFLLGQAGLDARLTSFCQLIEPSVAFEELPLKMQTKQALHVLSLHARQSNQPLQFYFQGPPGAGKRGTAEAIAAALKTDLLMADLRQVLHLNIAFDQTLRLLFREARFQNAVLYLPEVDRLSSREQEIPYQRLLEELANDTGITILSGIQPWVPAVSRHSNIMSVSFATPEFEQRRGCWQVHLTAAGISLDEQSLDVLADRFRLTPGQIAQAVTAACNESRWRVANRSPARQLPLSHDRLTLDDLFAAARGQSGHDLKALARKLEPRYAWDDIVLPSDPLAQLKEICNQVKYRRVVYGEWGFDRKLSLGKGLNVLFSGPPGTGKTMAAEVIANALQLDLYKIDLSQVVSKYIGETEKNLDRIFTAAENANAILFFDEADALFGKRSEVKDAHDRYANIEIGYLLQKMEEYEGIAILATNLRQNIDEAFVRRIGAIVEFPFPDEEYRRHIWEVIFPREAPLGEDVNFSVLARQVKLAGGNIKNIALAAAFYAAEEGRVIRMQHLVQAVRRECQKLGRTWNESEWGT
jgi:SpoVK/Ycf46/Vps4 family AAA+-type ATPase